MILGMHISCASLRRLLLQALLYCSYVFFLSASINSTALSVLRREGQRGIRLAWRSCELCKEQKEILRVSSPSEHLPEWRAEAKLSKEKSEGTERGRGEGMMEGE